MRSTTTLRAGAAFTALALGLTLGAGSAGAADSSPTATQAVAGASADRSAAFGQASAGTAKASAITITAFKIRSGVISSKSLAGIYGDVLSTGTGTVTSAVTQVRVNGVYKGTVTLFPGRYSGSGSTVKGGGINYPRTWGSGRVQLGPSTFTYSDQPTSVDGHKSNVFYVRKLIKTTRSDNRPLKISRKGKKITFRARQIKVVNPANGKYVSAKKVKLQYKSGSTWKTKKTIKLNSKGNGSYKRSTSSRHRYRLYIPQTSKTVQFRTRTSSKL